MYTTIHRHFQLYTLYTVYTLYSILCVQYVYMYRIYSYTILYYTILQLMYIHRVYGLRSEIIGHGLVHIHHISHRYVSAYMLLRCM